MLPDDDLIIAILIAVFLFVWAFMLQVYSCDVEIQHSGIRAWWRKLKLPWRK